MIGGPLKDDVIVVYDNVDTHNALAKAKKFYQQSEHTRITRSKDSLGLTSSGGLGVARLPSSGRSAACPQAESAVLLQRLSVLPPAEQEGGPPNDDERDW